MLVELKVRELALVESADVRFGRGLNLLTGETGSGKSLIVDALGLALGDRAQLDQVRHGADRALAEATFEVTAGGAAAAELSRMGYENERTLVLTRELSGRSLARINGRSAAPGQLRELATVLVAIQGQATTGAHHPLRDSEQQTLLLDAFGRCEAARAAVAGAHRAWASAQSELHDLESLSARGRREEEYLRWQLGELTAANLVPGEDEELAGLRGVVRHAVRLRELADQALAALDEPGVALAAARMRSAAELDQRLGSIAEKLEMAQEDAADAAGELRRYTESLDSDPARLEEIEARLAALESVKRRFGGSIESAIAERDRLEATLAQTEDLAGAIARAQHQVDSCRASLEGAAVALTELRMTTARQMALEVTRELSGLRLEGARFEVLLRPRDIGPDGAEDVEMLFSANPGEPLAPVQRVASGGELARLMLAIRTVAAEADGVPTLIFDEVDAGIGGEAALRVGTRLKQLASGRQVLVVTHLPQIACFADHHLLVEKRPDRSGRNTVVVRELTSAADRAQELARMMSGSVTDKALARASELLDEAAAVA